jgi:hypothetical protein
VAGKPSRMILFDWALLIFVTSPQEVRSVEVWIV